MWALVAGDRFFVFRFRGSTWYFVGGGSLSRVVFWVGGVGCFQNSSRLSFDAFSGMAAHGFVATSRISRRLLTNRQEWGGSVIWQGLAVAQYQVRALWARPGTRQEVWPGSANCTCCIK